MTVWRDVWTRAAAKERESIPLKQRQLILDAVEEFCLTGRGHIDTIKPIVGEYRLRVGEWRVRFSLDVARGELVVLHVLNRRDAYRD